MVTDEIETLFLCLDLILIGIHGGETVVIFHANTDYVIIEFIHTEVV